MNEFKCMPTVTPSPCDAAMPAATMITHPLPRRLPLGSVEHQSHQDATDETGNRDSHDPGEEQETDTLPVDSLDVAVAETHADGRASDAHGRRDGESVLREEENGDGGTHLHGRATAGGVVGELVSHD